MIINVRMYLTKILLFYIYYYINIINKGCAQPPQPSTIACGGECYTFSCNDNSTIQIIGVHCDLPVPERVNQDNNKVVCDGHLEYLSDCTIRLKSVCDGLTWCRFCLHEFDECICQDLVRYYAIEYRCSSSVPTAVPYSVAQCDGQYFDQQLCQYYGQGINISGAVYGEHESDQPQCNQTNMDCMSDIPADDDYMVEILSKCNKKLACEDLLSKGKDQDQPCNGSLYVAFSYTCQDQDMELKNASACNEDVIDASCDNDGYINIIHAFFGDMGALKTCDVADISPYDYRININDTDQNYYNTIVNTCEDKTSCDNLTAKIYNDDSGRFGYENYATEYVMLVYECIGGTTTDVPVTTEAQSEYTSREYTTTVISWTSYQTNTDYKSNTVTGTISVIDDTTLDGTGPPGTNNIVFIAVVTLLGALVIIVAVTVTIVILKRRKNHPKARSRSAPDPGDDSKGSHGGGFHKMDDDDVVIMDNATYGETNHANAEDEEQYIYVDTNTGGPHGNQRTEQPHSTERARISLNKSTSPAHPGIVDHTKHSQDDLEMTDNSMYADHTAFPLPTEALPGILAVPPGSKPDQNIPDDDALVMFDNVMYAENIDTPNGKTPDDDPLVMFDNVMYAGNMQTADGNLPRLAQDTKMRKFEDLEMYSNVSHTDNASTKTKNKFGYYADHRDSVKPLAPPKPALKSKPRKLAKAGHMINSGPKERYENHVLESILPEHKEAKSTAEDDVVEMVENTMYASH